MKTIIAGAVVALSIGAAHAAEPPTQVSPHAAVGAETAVEAQARQGDVAANVDAKTHARASKNGKDNAAEGSAAAGSTIANPGEAVSQSARGSGGTATRGEEPGAGRGTAASLDGAANSTVGTMGQSIGGAVGGGLAGGGLAGGGLGHGRN